MDKKEDKKFAKLSEGVERNLDRLGRVVIPKEMRDRLNFETSQLVSINLINNHIVIKKSCSTCLFCAAEDNLKEYKNYVMCESCLKELVDILSE